ncbi:MAG: hypothetical protein K6L76_07670 [Agarilytica sp.]
MNKYLLKNICLISILLSAASQSFAERAFRVEANVGIANSTSGGYDDGVFIDPSVAYTNALIYRLGYLEIDQMYLIDTNLGKRDVEIEIDGVYAGIGKDFKLKGIKLEIGGGIILAKSEGYYKGRRFSDDREARPYLNSKLVIPIGGLFALQGEIKYINDVSGSDLTLFGGGARFSF